MKPDLRKWSHDHRFGQDVQQAGEKKTLLVIGITAVMMVVEIAAGMVFGSMALLADGLHMASHAAALGISAFAYIYARRHAADTRFSFGTGKVNAMGGFTGALLLAVFALVMAWESVERLLNPVEITFNSAIAVAIIGLIVNGISVLILGDNHDHGHDHGHGNDHDHHHDHGHHDHNLKSAYLHVLADALTSVTAIIALLAAKYFGWIWMDPVMGIVGSLLVAKWSTGLLKQTTKVLLDHQAPEFVEGKVRSLIQSDGHSHVSDLHIWEIGQQKYAVILSIVSDSPQTTEVYKDKLKVLKFAHITVEVNPFETSVPETSPL